MLNVFLFSLLFLWSAHAFVREISSGKETSVVRIGTPEIDIESHRISFSVDAPFLDHTWAGSEEFSDYDDYFATYRNTTSPKLYDTNVVVEERVPFPVTNDTSGLHILCYCEDNTDSACSVNHTHGVVAHVFGDVLEVSYVRSDIDGLLRTFCELPDEEYWNTLSANVRNDSPMFVRTDSFEFGDAMIPVVISNEGISFQGMLMTRVDNKPPFVRSVLPDFLTGGMSDGTFVACQQSLLIETPAGDRVHFPRNGGHPLSTSDADLALTFVNATITYESDDTIQITAAPGNELEGVFPIKNMTMGSFYRTHADFCAIETTSPLTMVPLDRFGSVDEVIEIVQVLRHPIAMQYFDLYPSLEETTTLPIPRTIANVGTCASSFVTINDIHKIKKDRVFSETQFSDGVDGYDDWLRLTMNDMSVYVTQSSPSNQLFSDDGDHITYTGFPTALRTAPLLHKPQNDSFITQTTTYSDAEGRHMIKLHMESSLEDLSRCKFRNEDGFLQDVVTVDDESESDWIFYSFYPTWMQLYPRRLNGLPGARNTYSKEFSIGVSKTSRSTQVVDSGRDMFAQIISVRGEVGPVKGCPADDQGRLTFEIELTHAKNNPDDNNEVIGVYDIAHVTKYGDDCYDFPTSDQTLASERQSISQPNCPMNSPFCYQILQLTTSCRQLSIEGDSFSTGCGRFNFATTVRSCPNQDAWDDNKFCFDAPTKDQVKLTALDHYVYPLPDTSTDALHVDLLMSIFRSPNADTFNDAIDKQVVSNNDFSERDVAKFTEDEYITVGIRPFPEPFSVPLVFLDLIICKGPISMLQAYANSESPMNARCTNEFTGVTILRNNMPTTECDGNPCIENDFLPKSIDDPLTSEFVLCQTYGVSCDVTSIRAKHIIDALGYTTLGEAYLVESVVYVGALHTSRRRALLDSDLQNYEHDDSSFCMLQVIEDPDNFERQLQEEAVRPVAAPAALRSTDETYVLSNNRESVLMAFHKADILSGLDVMHSLMLMLMIVVCVLSFLFLMLSVYQRKVRM